MSDDNNFDNSCIICMKEYNQLFRRKVRLICMHCICITCTIKSFISLKCSCPEKQSKHIHCAVCRFPSAKNDIIYEDELDSEEEWNPPEEEEPLEREVLPPPPTPPQIPQNPIVEEVIVIDDSGAPMESVTENVQHPAPEVFPAMDLYYQLVQHPNNDNYVINELEYIKQLILQLYQQ